MKIHVISICFIMTTLLSCDIPQAQEDYPHARAQMIKNQIKNRGIQDPQVLKAMGKVPRHLFMPRNKWHWAYNDHAAPIGEGQTISQPYVVAIMTAAAQLDSQDRVLEIGTGSGYQAAILAEIVEEVYTIEIVKKLADRSKNTLTQLGYTNIFFKHGDGYKGWADHAPFDAIIVTAAPETIPKKLIEQLAEGGRMVVPVGKGNQELLLITKTAAGITQERLLPVRFVPMIKGIEK